jgi:glycosyltransferase involved in cell wall biosynthesis
LVLSVHIYPSTFEFETRILKVTKTLLERTAIDRVIIIANYAPHLARRERIDDKREVWRIGTKPVRESLWIKALWFLAWSLQVVWALKREPVAVVNCHSLSVLPLCVAVKTWHRALLVYEPHEHETETATFTRRKSQPLAKMLERALIGRAAKVIVVSSSIARSYRTDYRLDDVPVIMNVPPLGNGQPPQRNHRLRDLFHIPDEALLFMFQGSLAKERGVGELLEAFRQLPQERRVVIMGYGPMADEVKAAANCYENIHFVAAVPPEEVLDYTLGADVGIALIDDGCLNHQFALPNRLFQYLHAGLPVIVSDLPEMAAVVDRWQCGWRVVNTAQAIMERVATLTASDVAGAAEGARRSRETLNWETEADKLAVIYRDLSLTSETPQARASLGA